MIHVSKSENPPSEFASKGYMDDAVKEQLLKDQHNKCYLCERHLHTNYQVEHLKSKSKHPSLTNEWMNLFMACEYCNGKKLDDYDDILNPADTPIEQLISQRFDVKSEVFSFRAVGKIVDEEARAKTIRLLTVIFNGKNPKMPTLKEKRFQSDFRIVFNAFQKLVNDFLVMPDEKENLAKIKSEMNDDAEFFCF